MTSESISEGEREGEEGEGEGEEGEGEKEQKKRKGRKEEKEENMDEKRVTAREQMIRSWSSFVGLHELAGACMSLEIWSLEIWRVWRLWKILHELGDFWVWTFCMSLEVFWSLDFLTFWLGFFSFFRKRREN